MTAGRFRAGISNRPFGQARQAFVPQSRPQYQQSPTGYQFQQQQTPFQREGVRINPAVAEVPDDVMRRSQMEDKDAFWEGMDLRMQQAIMRAIEQGTLNPPRQTTQNQRTNNAPKQQTVAAATGQVEGKAAPTTSKNA